MCKPVNDETTAGMHVHAVLAQRFLKHQLTLAAHVTPQGTTTISGALTDHLPTEIVSVHDKSPA